MGAVNKPTRYNPVLNYDKSVTRRNHVISQMGKYGYISQADADSLMALPIVLDYRQQDHNTSKAPYFRDMLRKYMSASEPERDDYYFEEDYLADLDLWENDPLYGWINKTLKPDGTPYSLDKDGLTIYTTVNSRMQRYAEEAVVQHLSKDLQPAFFKDLKDNPHRPFAKEVPYNIRKTVMEQARRWSDRYRNMRSAGASEKAIEKAFNEKVEMRIFSWNANGYIDTVMTPDDSIRYYKSILRASFVAMEPTTGHIKAYIGGPEYRYFKYDNARQGKRQVGSTIKPFLYTLAMQEGYYPCDKVLNVPQTFVLADTTWTPESEDRLEYIGKDGHGGDVPQARHHLLSGTLPVPLPGTCRHHPAGDGQRVQHLPQPRSPHIPDDGDTHRGQRGQCARHLQSPQAGSCKRGDGIPDGQSYGRCGE